MGRLMAVCMVEKQVGVQETKPDSFVTEISVFTAKQMPLAAMTEAGTTESQDADVSAVEILFELFTDARRKKIMWLVDTIGATINL